MHHARWKLVLGLGVAALVSGAAPGCGSSGETLQATSQGTTTGPATTTSGAGGTGHGGGGTTTSAGGAGGAHGGACSQSAQCLSPAAPVCDPKTGQCVACTEADDVCPKGQVCLGTTCKAGCADDTDCSMGGKGAGGGDAGGQPLVCNTSTHQCVGCTGDASCPAGTICSGDTCVAGCNVNHACQPGAECCADTCVDTKSDPNNCGSCKPCPAPSDAHAQPVCTYGQCGFGACDPGYADCNNDPSDGCETDLKGQAACPCVPGQEYDCYDGPAGTKGVGICKGGKGVCQPDGLSLGPCVGEILPAAETCDDLLDNNCDGQINEGGIDCVCKPNEKAPCYDGPAGTENVGTCKDGAKQCDDHGKAWGPCVGEVLPAAQLCTVPAQDQNCNGQLNEGCSCVPGDAIECYGGPPNTKNVGICKAGTQTCQQDGQSYGPCVGQVLPQQENCFSPADENCNGVANEGGPGCVCSPNASVSCYDGPAGTLGVGPCKAGTKTCNALGTAYSACQGEVVPVLETCLTPIDDNCNGQVNEGGVGCACLPGATQPCYDGPAGTLGVGYCKAGVQTCNDQGTGWLPTCAGEVLPVPETCLTPGDDNCNGQVNEGGVGCNCKPGATQSCYDGPAGTLGVGICQAGTQTCQPDGTGFGPCQGEVLPQPESCLTLVDDNCNGQVNEGGIGCVCKPGSTQGCYDGPAGTLGKGICKGGTQTCNVWGTEWGQCLGEVLPQPESCVAPSDFNCDGVPLVCNNAADDCNPATGQCTPACSPDMLGQSYVGCVYYPTVTANLVDSSVFHFSVAVSNTGSKPATITVTKGGAAVTSGTVQANSVQIFNLPWVSALKGPSSNSVTPMPSSIRVNAGAYQLVSNRPVTVYQYNPLEYNIGNAYSYTNDASLLLPVNVWTGNYRVAARHHFYSTSGFFAVTAQANGTTVTVTPPPGAHLVKAGVAGISTNDQGTVTMNAGDVIEIVTDGTYQASDPNDVTGTLVTASLPVQVIGGHQCIYIPDNSGYCDHIEESMPPIETLSKEYLVTAPLIPTQASPRQEMVRIIATQPNTTLTYDPPQPGAPASIAQAGGWVEISLTAASFKVIANYKVYVAQYMVGETAAGGAASGDPAMALAVATDQYRTSYLFHAPTNYQQNYVNITAKTGEVVTLDGAVIAQGSFSAVGGATGYSVARLLLPNVNGGNHTVSAANPIGISVYGYGQYTSYWYPGGLDLNAIPGL
jgi:hypothetical protein